MKTEKKTTTKKKTRDVEAELDAMLDPNPPAPAVPDPNDAPPQVDTGTDARLFDEAVPATVDEDFVVPNLRDVPALVAWLVRHAAILEAAMLTAANTLITRDEIAAAGEELLNLEVAARIGTVNPRATRGGTAAVHSQTSARESITVFGECPEYQQHLHDLALASETHRIASLALQRAELRERTARHVVDLVANRG